MRRRVLESFGTAAVCLSILLYLPCAPCRAAQHHGAVMHKRAVSGMPLQLAQASPGISSVQSQHQAVVTGIKYLSDAAPARIVINLDHMVTYHAHLLRRDDALKKPPRLYIDLLTAKLSPHLAHTIPVESGVIKKVRAGQHTPHTVRVVLDLERPADYKIFSLTDPFRIVIDIAGESPAAQQGVPPMPSAPSQPSPSSTQQFNAVQIQKQAAALGDLSQEYKKNLCTYFANTVKACHALKSDGVGYKDALVKTEAKARESIVEKHMPKHVLQVTEDACTIAYSLPEDAMNIEQTYRAQCMDECRIALENDKLVLASFVETPMITTPPPDASKDNEKKPQSAGQFEILEAKMKVIKKYTDWDYVQCSWLVKIKNNTDEELKLRLTIDYVDNKGFKIEDSYKNVLLKPNEVTTVSDICPLFSLDEFGQIYHLKAYAKKY